MLSCFTGRELDIIRACERCHDNHVRKSRLRVGAIRLRIVEDGISGGSLSLFVLLSAASLLITNPEVAEECTNHKDL